MKTRIKIVQYSDGTKKYFPQCLVYFFFWDNFYDVRGGSAESFDTEEEAVAFIKHNIPKQITHIDFK